MKEIIERKDTHGCKVERNLSKKGLFAGCPFLSTIYLGSIVGIPTICIGVKMEEQKELTLLETWRGIAYSTEVSQQESDKFWSNYFVLEQGIYEQILANPDEVVTGTVKELAEKYNVELLIMVGFLDGINESLKQENPIDTMTEDTVVNLGFDKESLYKNMVEAKAEWLYTLEAWNSLISEDRRRELYREQKSSHTIVKGAKVGRNDPCPCGSGKKYKFCCGR